LPNKDIPAPENRREPEPVWNKIPLVREMINHPIYGWIDVTFWVEEKVDKVPLWGSWWSGL